MSKPTKSAVIFRLCWAMSLGGLVAAIPLLTLLYLGAVKPKYTWTIHFWEVLTIGLTVLCAASLREYLKARRS